MREFRIKCIKELIDSFTSKRDVNVIVFYIFCTSISKVDSYKHCQILQRLQLCIWNSISYVCYSGKTNMKTYSYFISKQKQKRSTYRKVSGIKGKCNHEIHFTNRQPLCVKNDFSIHFSNSSTQIWRNIRISWINVTPKKANKKYFS